MKNKILFILSFFFIWSFSNCGLLDTSGGVNYGSSTIPSNSNSASSTVMPQVADPVFSPVGGTFATSQSITISTTTTSAVIYYTNDGSVPTCSGTNTLYSVPLTVGTTQTLKAIACEPNMSDSNVVSETYTITTPTGTVATPLISPGTGTYSSTQTVTISPPATAGATFGYTVDGSTPTCGTFTTQMQAVVSTTGTIIKALGCKSGMTDSAIATATYTINSSFQCPNGSWSYNGMGTIASPCATCASDPHSTGASTSASGSTSCVCNSGSVWFASSYSGYCESCTSAQCPANTWSASGYQDSSCGCTSCSPPATPNGGGHSFNGSTIGTTGSKECTCATGYTWHVDASSPSNSGCTKCGGMSESCCGGIGGSCTGTLVCTSTGVCNVPCFKKGTKVLTPKGEIRIEKIKAGDIVYSYNEKNKKLVESKVLKPLAHKDGKHPALILTLENGIKLNVTTTHRFYSPKDGKYHPLNEFKVGDKVLLYKDSATKEVVIKSMVPQAPFPVSYNLELGDGPHNYLVEGIVVHNHK